MTPPQNPHTEADTGTGVSIHDLVDLHAELTCEWLCDPCTSAPSHKIVSTSTCKHDPTLLVCQPHAHLQMMIWRTSLIMLCMAPCPGHITDMTAVPI